MGFFSDHFKTEYDGHTIEMETRTVNMFLGVMRYSLIVDNRRVEDLDSTIGTFSLRGTLGDPPGKPIAVRVKQGFFGTQAFLEVDGQSLQMPRA